MIADAEQPRKIFAPDKLAALRKSIEKHGIMTPIIVEKDKDKYLIVDGERRFRVATLLGLKEVPIIVIEPQSKTDRLIQQFHIQEQHEAWTAAEKAMAVVQLADETGLDVKDIANTLSIDPRQAERYIAFSKLVDKELFQKNRINLKWVEPINQLKGKAQRVFVDQLGREFLRSDERTFEKAVINGIMEGNIQGTHDVTKLKDSFTKEPKSIIDFMDRGATPESLFIKTKAKGAYHLRNLASNARACAINAVNFMRIGDVEVDGTTMKMAKTAHARLGEFIKNYETDA